MMATVIVERTYWNGKLSGYLWDGMTVPIARGNSHFQAIRKAIHDGTCIVVEPTFGKIHRGVDRHGNPSGFRTRFGFVPDYKHSHLLRLINAQLADGSCEVAEPPIETQAARRYETLVLTTILAQPWPGIVGECSGNLAYRAMRDKPSQPYKFVLRNLPNGADDRLEILLKTYGAAVQFPFRNSPHKFGVLEIEIPLSLLRSMYTNERKLLPSGESELVATLVEQHFAESRRSRREGPDISWLINNAHLYTAHFAVEFSNRIFDAFRLEYGRAPLSYIVEGYYRIQPLIFGREANGFHHLLVANFPSQNNTPVPQEWHSVGLERYDQESQSPDFLLRTALRRVSDLVAIGFHAEALAPLNAFLEVLVLKSLQSCVRDSPHMVVHLERMGHKDRLSIITLIANSQEISTLFDENFKKSLRSATEIYKRRNAYVHSLQITDVVGRPTLLDRRTLEKLFFYFMDVHEQNQVFMRFGVIARGEGRTKDLVLAEVLRRYDRWQKRPQSSEPA